MPNNLNNKNINIAISVGEPAGIGPDIVLKVLSENFLDYLKQNKNLKINLKIFADQDLLKQRADLLNIDFDLIKNLENFGCLNFLEFKTKNPVIPGVLDPENALYVLNCVEQAALYSQKNNAALVTGPIHKGVINQGLNNNKNNFYFSGHTEFLRDLAQKSYPENLYPDQDFSEVVMMLVSQNNQNQDLNLKIALATTHIPLSQVSEKLTPELLEKVIKILDLGLKKYFNKNNLTNFPKIALCGLNPHAGENGYIGREEIEWIEPLVNKINKNKINISGPYSGDSIFNLKNRKNFDVILALYHDQGLAPFKALCFGEGVNITLGLPYLRTSVDHGTALDLAGTGKADAQSFWEALLLAMQQNF